MQQDFKRHINSLGKIFEFLQRFLVDSHVDQKTARTMDLVVEELFTNMVKYNADAVEDITICLERKENSLLIKLVDPNSKPFDITKKEDPDLGLSLEDRNPGGLGIYMVKKLADTLTYQYDNGRSSITVTIQLE